MSARFARDNTDPPLEARTSALYRAYRLRAPAVSPTANAPWHWGHAVTPRRRRYRTHSTLPPRTPPYGPGNLWRWTNCRSHGETTSRLSSRLRALVHLATKTTTHPRRRPTTSPACSNPARRAPPPVDRPPHPSTSTPHAPPRQPPSPQLTNPPSSTPPRRPPRRPAAQPTPHRTPHRRPPRRTRPSARHDRPPQGRGHTAPSRRALRTPIELRKRRRGPATPASQRSPPRPCPAFSTSAARVQSTNGGAASAVRRPPVTHRLRRLRAPPLHRAGLSAIGRSHDPPPTRSAACALLAPLNYPTSARTSLSTGGARPSRS